jgi:L,D-transpeptidase YcbB
LRTSWHGLGFERQKRMTSARVQLSRRATITGGAAALAAACALTGCAANPSPVMDPVLDLTSAPPQPADTDLGNRIGTGPGLEVAGQTLNTDLLRRFYAHNGFEPVWASRQTQVDSLVNIVRNAGDQGLDPELFHASALQHRDDLSPIDADLLLSDAFLSYADALARGAVPIERRKKDETLTPGPIDVADVLNDALDNDPASAIIALAPTTPTYQALLQALQNAHTGGKAASGHLRTIAVNLERQRWLPRSLPTERVWVNVADESLVFYRADLPVFSTRVVVGQDAAGKQSPEFRAMIDASFFNPPWVVPSDIVKAEIQPLIDHDPDYLTKNDMILLSNGDAEQLPGPEAGLGLIMFDMPNRFDVFLHDTPNHNIFNLNDRRISHGCIRVQNPVQLASLLLQQSPDSINQEIAAGGTTRHDLPAPVPVFVVYQTAFVDTDGTLQFRPDFYKRDDEIWQLLQKRPDDTLPA